MSSVLRQAVCFRFIRNGPPRRMSSRKSHELKMKSLPRCLCVYRRPSPSVVQFRSMRLCLRTRPKQEKKKIKIQSKPKSNRFDHFLLLLKQKVAAASRGSKEQFEYISFFGHFCRLPSILLITSLNFFILF